LHPREIFASKKLTTFVSNIRGGKNVQWLNKPVAYGLFKKTMFAAANEKT